MSYPAGHRIETKNRIIRNARRLFNRYGFDAVSIDDVMADAGFTRGSFYIYFESKGDLYAEAVSQILNEKQLLSGDGVSVHPGPSKMRLSSFATIFRWSISRISTEAAL
jgi:AcrR family transcriptional regulator